MKSLKSRLTVTTLSMAVASLALSACATTVKTEARPNNDSTGQSASATAQSTTSQAEESPSAEPSSQETSESPESPEPSSPSETATSEAPASTDPTVNLKAMVAPGSKLKFGESAVFYRKFGTPDKDYFNEYLFDVKFTSIEKANVKDFEALKDGAKKLEGYTPYYVRGTMTLKGSSKTLRTMGATASTSGFTPTLVGGASAGRFTVLGSFAPCKSGGYLKSVGESAEVCVIAVAPQGAEVGGMRYNGEFSNYPNYKDNPYTQNPVIFTK